MTLILPGGPLSGPEYPRYPVGFGQDGGVADAEAKADADGLCATHQLARLGDEQEGHGVAQEDPQQQDERELPAWRLHHGRVGVTQEHQARERDGQDAHGGEGHGGQSRRVSEGQVDRGDLHALGHVVAREGPHWALFTSGGQHRSTKLECE